MPRRYCNWEGSWIDEVFLESLASRGLLPRKDQCEWRAPGEEVISDPHPGEVVVFVEHVERGFKPPGSLFFCSLMQRLGLRLHDIGPNSMLQVSNFHVLCEDYLGIPPSIDFWLALFSCSSQREATDAPFLQCGAISFQRRRGSLFPKLALANKVKGWQRTFFYCKDTSPEHEIHLPSRSPLPFEATSALSSKPDPSSLSSIESLLDKVRALLLHGLTGLDLISCWTKWRIQPVSRRLRLMVDFSCHADDIDRTCPDDWDKGEWINFIRRVTDEDIDSYDNVGLAPFWAEHKPFVIDPYFWTLPSEEANLDREAVAESSKQIAAPGEDTPMHNSASELEGSASEEEQQMADALLSTAPSTYFLEFPEVTRRSSKRLLTKGLEDPSQPEKRRKALALLVETRTTKSLRFSNPAGAIPASDHIAEDCLSISSGSDLQDLSSPSSGCLMKSIRTASGAMIEGDAKSVSSDALSQPAMSEDNIADENMGTSGGATYLKPSLEEGIAGEAPAMDLVATTSATPVMGKVPAEIRVPTPEATARPDAGSSKSIADAIIAAGDKHAALLRDLVGQLSSSRQLELSLLDASGSAKGKGISLDQPEATRSVFEQSNETIQGQAQEIRTLKNQLDSCEEQFKELEADSKQRLMEKDEVIKSLRDGLAIKSELLDRLKGDHARELAARDEKYNSLLKAFEGFGSAVKSATLQLAGSDAAVSRSNLKDQLEYLHDFGQRLLKITKEVVTKISPATDTTTSCEHWLNRLFKVPHYVSDWKRSSARTGAAHVLTLLRAYYPEIDVGKIASHGRAKRADDTDLPMSEYFDIWKGMCGYATTFAENLDLGTYLGKFNHDGSKVIKEKAAGADSSRASDSSSRPGGPSASSSGALVIRTPAASAARQVAPAPVARKQK